MHFRLSGLLVLPILACAGHPEGPDQAPGPSVRPDPSQRVPTASRWVPEDDHACGGDSHYSWGLTSMLGDDREQHFTISVKGTPEPRGWLEVLDLYLDGKGREGIRTAHKVELDLRPWDVTSAGLDRFAVTGMDGAGGIVVETWTLEDAPALSLKGAPLEADERGPAVARQFRKFRIYEGEPADSVGPLVFDSRARSLLFLTFQGQQAELVRLKNAPGAMPERILDSDECPALLRLEAGNVFYQDGVGTCYEFVPGLQGQITDAPGLLFIDKEDDGAFDGPPLVATSAALAARGIGAFSDRRDAYFR